jgi:hypothetical protein
MLERASVANSTDEPHFVIPACIAGIHRGAGSCTHGWMGPGMTTGTKCYIRNSSVGVGL